MSEYDMPTVMNQELFDAAIATLTAELNSATDERMKERLTAGIDHLKASYPELVTE